MKTPQKMAEAFDLAEQALLCALQAVDNALDENECGLEHEELVVAVMEFAGRIYSSSRKETVH